MNIFFLSSDPKRAASYHCDKHVCKMIIESAQLLSTAHHVLGSSANITVHLYKPTHMNHPSAVWVRKSSANYDWVHRLLLALLDEYTFRYKKIHACSRIGSILVIRPMELRVGKLTRIPLCMPEEYMPETKRYTKREAVEAYRQYYIGEKSRFAVWKTKTPKWFSEQNSNTK